MRNDRPPIPEPIKRAVRQRCGFGCVVCGFPIYDYHHMSPYSEVREHTEENLTLLCKTHHGQVPHLLTNEQVAKANNRPYCRQRGITSPYGLQFEGHSAFCLVGTCMFMGASNPIGDTVFRPIAIDGIDPICLRIRPDGALFVSATIFDENNSEILIIRENELVLQADQWDVEFKGPRLILRQGRGRVFFDIEFRPPNELWIRRARLLYNGIEVRVRRNYVYVANSRSIFAHPTIKGPAIGIRLGDDDRRIPTAIQIAPECTTRYKSQEVIDAEEREDVAKLESEIKKMDEEIARAENQQN